MANEKLTQQQVKETKSWQNGKLNELQVAEMTVYVNSKLSEQQDNQMANWQSDKLIKKPVDKMTDKVNSKLTKWQINKAAGKLANGNFTKQQVKESKS